jgi:hypothetical protein
MINERMLTDDCITIGKESIVTNLINELSKNGFNSKIEKDFSEYFSCFTIQSKNERNFSDYQPHHTDLFDWKFGDKFKEKRKFLNPCTPRFKIQKSTEEMDILDANHHK